MTLTVREAGPYERMMTLTLAAEDIESAKGKAARRLAQEINVKGFRPGKAPRPIVEATVGAARLRSEAIDDLIPEKVQAALAEADLRPAVSPAVESLREVPAGVEVDVRITLWPVLETAPEFRGRKVEVPSPELAPEDLDSQITRLLERNAALEGVDRPARVGDFVALDISAEHNGLPVEEANATELLYEVGSGGFIVGMDEQLEGKQAGAVVRFGAPLPPGFGDKAGLPVVFDVAVKEVKRKVLPELTDEWVADATEFETVDELRQGVAERLSVIKRQAVAESFREIAFETLVNEVSIEIPEALVTAEMDDILHRFVHRLGDQDITLSDYLKVTGITEEEFLDDLRRQGDRNLRAQVLLEAVAREEQLVVEPMEVESVVERLVSSAKDPASVRSALTSPVQELALRGDILRGKALDVIVDAAIPVDADGNRVDISPEETPAASDFQIEEEDNCEA